NIIQGSWINEGRLLSRRKKCRTNQKNDKEQQVNTCRANKTFLLQSVHGRLGGSVRAEIFIPLRWHMSNMAITSFQRLFSSARTYTIRLGLARASFTSCASTWSSTIRRRSIM